MSRDLISAERDELNRLRAEVAELREEVAAWRCFDADPVSHLDRPRADSIKKRLGVRPGEAVVLVKLMQSSPLPCTTQALLEATSAMPGLRKHPDDRIMKNVTVRIFVLRSAFARLGLSNPIETIWGVGYAVPSSALHAIETLLEKAAA